MSNELVAQSNVPNEIMAYKPIAEEFQKSGLFTGIKSAAQAFAVIQYGRELGLQPICSLQNINIIQGKPTINTQAMLSIADTRGINWNCKKETAEECIIEFTKGERRYTSRFTFEEAKQMALTGKDNWKKQPKTMLFWRAVAQGIRKIDPGAMLGLYTADEIEHIGPDNAKPVECEVIEPEVQEPPPPEEKPNDQSPEYVFKSTLISARFANGDDQRAPYNFFDDMCTEVLGKGYNHENHFLNSHAKFIREKCQGDFDSATIMIEESPETYATAYRSYLEEKAKPEQEKK